MGLSSLTRLCHFRVLRRVESLCYSYIITITYFVCVSGGNWQRMAVSLPSLSKWRRRIPHSLFHPAHPCRQTHVLHGDGNGTVLQDKPTTVVGVRANRQR